jgi:hypothetical protein
MRSERLHREADTRVPPALVDSADHVADEDDNFYGEADVPGMLRTWTHFIDPRCNLLELLTPTATQNRPIYLVELSLDRS